jgi:hypothetical protein
MTEEQAREDIRIIKSMLEKTKKASAESVGIFIVWGVLMTIAMAMNYIMSLSHAYRGQWIVWAVAGGIGWVASFISGFRYSRRPRLSSYVQTAARHLYIASGVGFAIVCFAFPMLKIYSYEEIPMLFSVVAGILFFTMGGVFESPSLTWLGLFWWVGGTCTVFIKGDARQLAFAVLFLIGYDIPAIALWLRHRREAASSAATRA